MKKLLNSDWLRAVQLKSKTSAKSVITSARCVTPVQITNQNSWVQSSVNKCQIEVF